jgi:metal-sulfur cluster biosynthetic enzyme
MLEKLVIFSLKDILDPEIQVNIYDLGLVYDIQVSKNLEVKILITLTTYNCPMIETFPHEIEKKIQTIEKIRSVKLYLTFDPKWSMEMISENARVALGMLF